MKSETAASDLIAVMALIAVFVTAAAIIGVTLLSIPPGDAAPAMIARSVVTDDGHLSIRHDGGDPLVKGHFKILVNDVDQTEKFLLDGDSDWMVWETGQILVFSDDLPEGAHIQIAGEGVDRTGGDWLLHEIPTVDPAPIPLIADFTADVTSGFAPLTVRFTDTSTGEPTSWFWDFGDGATSTEQNPIHTYTAPGTYTVSLTVNNAADTASVTKSGYIVVTKKSTLNEIIFIYGKTLKFSGNTINGPGATTIITGGLKTNDLNGGASIAVSNLYIDGDVTLDGGSAGLGSKEKPGVIYINGDLTLVNGQRHVYGDVYVNGDFDLKDARIHGNVYVDGDLTLDWTPQLDDGSRIYYTGRLTKPDSYNEGLLAKCIHQTTVPKLDMPDEEFPSARSADWYAAKGYTSTLTNTKKVYASSYTASGSASDIIVVAYDGDISVGGGGTTVTGVFFAPKGKVTFNGDRFEGLVIARDGFDVTSGGTIATFKPISDYIADPDNYPFEQG
jgi:PKD repeat protein